VLEPLSTRHVISNLEITIEGRRAAVTASSVIFRRRGSAFFNTHATYQFGLSQHTQRGWLIDRIKQNVLWNEGDPTIHSGANQ